MVAGLEVDIHSPADEVSVADSSLAAGAAMVVDSSSAGPEVEITTEEGEMGVIVGAIMAAGGVDTTERPTTAATHLDRVIAVQATTITGETG